MQTHSQNFITLTNGQQIPSFGLGTFQIKNEQEMTNIIRTSLDVGYRLFDTAKFYENEHLIGNSLKIIFSEGKYKREDIVIITKLFPFKGQSTLEVVMQQLKDLQVDYIDILLIHFPLVPPSDDLQQWNHKPAHQIWAELEELYNLGLAKGLGVSNFNCQMIVDLLSYCKVRPVVNEIELHVFNQQTRFVEFLKKIKVYPIAYSPIAKYTEIINNQTVVSIAQKNNVSVAQVMIAFLLQQQDIIVIPKTEKLERLQHNFDAQKLKFSEEEMQILRNLNINMRTVNVDTIPSFKGVPLFD
ncbi:aldo/keto reductase family oxidoreductase (macronuclear) [Tetrahymena thermophila SB210]|uniref:Aldo/keto reductase family oxidoreductase n=1 Tax=Tetrahymena thermophila (strain SB210) TaxID=312017 RepID=I7MK44_TETTS|nr:aldo/keto reductase family oxidoreductase [Tetrahymena thermophila SB210]EAS07799.1 aldo/keto reductase family oxidoreductase [Tetrahymena thermophila SB210]|eukprot:XP_001028041.1 aldo/keto reductase family oxidoreductase [Tetrahymena thermophila SB210]